MKLIFYLQINTTIFYKLIVSLWVCMARHAQSTQNNNNGVDFSLLIIVKRFFKVILSFLMCVARHAQITQNKKFAISLQYLKKEVNDKVDFLHAGKHQSGLQVDFNTLGTKLGDKVILIRITDKHDEAFSNCSK